LLISSRIIASRVEVGGLSGAPVKPLALKTLKTLRSLLPADIPIIGSGGIWTGQDALDFAKAGAQMVQIYTSFGYNGVGTCRRIKDELVKLLEKEGKTWGQVVKEAVEKHSWREFEPKPTTIEQLETATEELKVYLGLGEREKAERGQRSAAQEATGGEAELEGAAQASIL